MTVFLTTIISFAIGVTFVQLLIGMGKGNSRDAVFAAIALAALVAARSLL